MTNAAAKHFSVENNLLSAAGRGRYQIPNFIVSAESTEIAIDAASRIVMCDRRTPDGILWAFTGTVRAVDSDERSTFSVTMTDR